MFTSDKLMLQINEIFMHVSRICKTYLPYAGAGISSLPYLGPIGIFKALPPYLNPVGIFKLSSPSSPWPRWNLQALPTLHNPAVHVRTLNPAPKIEVQVQVKPVPVKAAPQRRTSTSYPYASTPRGSLPQTPRRPRKIHRKPGL